MATHKVHWKLLARNDGVYRSEHYRTILFVNNRMRWDYRTHSVRAGLIEVKRVISSSPENIDVRATIRL